MHFKFVKIAKEGHIFVLIFAIITLLGFFISNVLGVILLALTIWCALFFRDPERVTPIIKDAVIAPADGIVQSIKLTSPPKELGLTDDNMLCISVFMNVFNVHINRTPVTGKVDKIVYCPGKFFNASLDKASEHNERQIFQIQPENHDFPVIMVQIAGLVARRIVKFINEDINVEAGEKIGLIRFGSRVDIYLPSHIVPQVIEGQLTIGGETILAKLSKEQPEAISGHVLDRAENLDIK